MYNFNLKGSAKCWAKVNASLHKASIEGSLNVLLFWGHETSVITTTCVAIPITLFRARAVNATLGIIFIPKFIQTCYILLDFKANEKIMNQR